MDDGLASVLRLVAEGRLSADEAAPIIEALTTKAGGGRETRGPAVPPSDGPEAPSQEKPRFARLEVRDGGRRVVDVRVPISLGRFALDRIPGLSVEHIAAVQRAVDSNTHGAILDVEDPDGDGVRIVLE